MRARVHNTSPGTSWVAKQAPIAKLLVKLVVLKMTATRLGGQLNCRHDDSPAHPRVAPPPPARDATIPGVVLPERRTNQSVRDWQRGKYTACRWPRVPPRDGAAQMNEALFLSASVRLSLTVSRRYGTR